MRFLLAFLILNAAAVAVTPAQLEAVKKQFPAHIAGTVTAKSHPEVQQCWKNYYDHVQRLTPDNLAQEVIRLSSALDREIYRYTRLAEDADNPLGGAGRHAARQNANWLRQRMVPYVRRLAALR
jgi:hypothetical protein